MVSLQGITYLFIYLALKHGYTIYRAINIIAIYIYTKEKMAVHAEGPLATSVSCQLHFFFLQQRKATYKKK